MGPSVPFFLTKSRQTVLRAPWTDLDNFCSFEKLCFWIFGNSFFEGSRCYWSPNFSVASSSQWGWIKKFQNGSNFCLLGPVRMSELTHIIQSIVWCCCHQTPSQSTLMVAIRFDQIQLSRPHCRILSEGWVLSRRTWFWFTSGREYVFIKLKNFTLSKEWTGIRKQRSDKFPTK